MVSSLGEGAGLTRSYPRGLKIFKRNTARFIKLSRNLPSVACTFLRGLGVGVFRRVQIRINFLAGQVVVFQHQHFGETFRRKQFRDGVHNVSAVCTVNAVLTADGIRHNVSGRGKVLRLFGVYVEFNRSAVVVYVLALQKPKKAAADRTD